MVRVSLRARPLVVYFSGDRLEVRLFNRACAHAGINVEFGIKHYFICFEQY